jgi:predicted dehydrogenase
MTFNRRNFVSAATATAASYSRVLGANEKIRVGLIGSGGQGRSDWKLFLKHPDVVPVAVADVYEPNLEEGLALANGQAKGYRDFRKLIERKDIDVVIVGTPDHWHALTTIMACEAGKDVYCEKPLSLAIREGRLMLNAARKNNRVVQTGSQQRSGPHYAQAVEIIRSGKLGKVPHIQASFIRNAMPGWGKAPDEQPPANLDWDMWLGPAPKVPYNKMRCLYHFRWFWDYSGGQMTNFGAHDIDIARWVIGARAPIAVAAFGGRFALEGAGETPDVQEVIYQFPECVLSWSVREMNKEQRSGLTFHGTKATMQLSRGGIQINGETWKGADAPKGPQAPDAKIPGTEQHDAHVLNFIECVKSRKRPNADNEEGHLTATMCHMGNIATRLNRSLRWDAAKEEFSGDAEANRWLQRPYRAPWKLA